MFRRFSKGKSEAERRLAEQIELLHNSPLVDPVWYRQTYADLRDTPIDVARHYLEHGAAEGRNPGPFFDTKFYLKQNPDVAASGMNPLVHYILRGEKEGRDAASEVSAKPLRSAEVVRKYRHVREVHYEVWRAPESLRGKNVCLFVAYAPDGYLPKSTIHYIRSLKHEGLTVIVIVASRNSGRPHADAEIECDGLISRDNIGYDFASWALGLQILPSIWQAKTVLCTNDSIFGPLSQPSFKSLMERIEASRADYIALTQSWQVTHHCQSYFFMLKEKALGHRGVKHFWADLEIVTDKDQAILRYEVPMLEMIRGFGLATEVMFPLGDRDFKQDMNPTLDHWRELIQSGFPFIKVQVLRDDISGVDNSNWTDGIKIDQDIQKAITERLDSASEQSRRIAVARPNK